MKKLHASGEDYLEAVLVLQKGKRHGKIRGCGPAHRSLQAQCMPCSDNTEGQRFSRAIPHRKECQIPPSVI